VRDGLHPGLRLLDGLVVTALILSLAAVLLPALLAAREETRSHACLDNLRQLGLAFQNYEAHFRSLPPAASGKDEADTNGEVPGQNHPEQTGYTTVNWVFLLLPYVGQEKLAAAFDRSVGMYHARNEKIRTTELSVMKCPDDSFNVPENHYLRPMGEGKQEARYARGNYGINDGTDCGCIYPGTVRQPCINGLVQRYADDHWSLEALGNGVAGYNKALKLKAFVNGISRIVALDELRAGLRPVDARGVWALAQWGADETFGHGLYEDNGRPNAITGRSDVIKGCPQLVKLVGRETLIRERMTCAADRDEPKRATARSMHPGGVNVLILDGSAHFISDNVDPIAWHVMHSRNNPEKIHLPFESGK